MIRKHLLILLALFFTITAFSQYNLNDYKFVIIPRKFDFLKQADQYQLNSLTKFLLEKENFTVIFDDENFPKDLANNRCLALNGNVINDSKLFKTKLGLVLKNCNNREVFATQFGESRIKDYQKAYHEALRGAFESFTSIDYQYQPKQIKQEKIYVDASAKVLSKEHFNKVAPPPPPKVEETVEVVRELPEKKVLKTEVLQQESGILYAQKTNFGYQLVDSTPKIVMVLLPTSKKDVFVVKDQNAIVYKEGEIWYKSGSESTSKKLNIKF